MNGNVSLLKIVYEGFILYKTFDSLTFVANDGANDQGSEESYRLNDELLCLIISVQ